MSAVDPFEVLAGLRPVADREAIQPGDDARIDALFRRTCDAAAAPAKPWRTTRQRRRRRIIGGGLVVVALGGSSLAAALITDGDGGDAPNTVVCFEQARPDSALVQAAIADERSATEACAAPWTNGAFGTDGPPPSVLCVNAAATLAVVPGDDDEACAAAGLEPAGDRPTNPGTGSASAAELYERLNLPLAATCFDQADTERLIDEVLSLPRFEGWAWAPYVPFSSDRPCGMVWVDVPAKTVRISPTPLPPPSSG